MDLFRKTAAVFSPCRTYRYELSRIWEPAKPILLFIMLNPSIANETDNDPTVDRCETRARNMGFGGIKIRNLFALVSTNPKPLSAHPDPIGPENDRGLIDEAKLAGMVICGWGANGKLLGRSTAVVNNLRREGIELYCLKMTKLTMQPQHPLYVGYNVQPIPYPL